MYKILVLNIIKLEKLEKVLEIFITSNYFLL